MMPPNSPPLLRILFVEASETERLTFRQAFLKTRVTIALTEAANAADALTRLKTDAAAFDLAVVAQNLPDMSGLELCRALLAQKIPLPLVLLLESGAIQLAAEALNAGVEDYLFKDALGGYVDLLPLALPKAAQHYHDRLARRQAEDALHEKEARYYTLLETVPHGVEECDPKGIITFANAAYHRMFGHAEGELVGTAIWDNVETEELRRKEHQRFATILRDQPPPFTTYTKKLTRTGRAIDLQVDWNYKRDSQGQLTGFISVLTDISDRKRAEESLREQNRGLALLNDMNSLLQACRTEAETYRVIINACKQLFPQDAGFLFLMDDSRTMLQEAGYWGTPPPEPRLFDVEDCWALRLGKMHAMLHPDAGLLCPHLHSFPAEGYVCAPIHASGGALGMLHLCFGKADAGQTLDERPRLLEVKQLMAARLVEQYSSSLVNLRLRETLRLESIRDPLTGLYNRRHMEASLEREELRAKRRGTPVAIIMLDIDHFKHLNDSHGHEAGDVALRELAALVRRHIRGEDIPCRYGGEEFILILPDAPLEIAQRRAEEIRLHGSELQIRYRDKLLTLTVSIGVAAFPDHGAELRGVVKVADDALYQAKKGGRNQVVVASM